MTQDYQNGMFIRRYQGNPDVPVIVWIHGLGESGLCFESIVQHPLLSPFSHWIPDLPGYGRSLHTERPITLEQLADAAARQIQTQFGAVVLAGHSMGGVIGQILARKHPDCVLKFINIEGNISPGDCVFSGRAAAFSEEEFLQSGFTRMLDRIYRAGLDEPALRGYYVSLRFCDPLQFHLNSRELVEFSREGLLARSLSTLSMPVLYIAGRPGGACVESMAQLKREDVPCVALNPSGHWPFLDQPERFAEEAANFLTAY